MKEDGFSLSLLRGAFVLRGALLSMVHGQGAGPDRLLHHGTVLAVLGENVQLREKHRMEEARRCDAQEDKLVWRKKLHSFVRFIFVCGWGGSILRVAYGSIFDIA